MRISDWSSDVCSSESGFEARTAKLVQQFDDYESIDGLHVKGELTLGENIADLGGLTVAHDALLKALADAGANAPGEIDGRSEEHTSELQSLMRISYAVFCLKKKKLY